MRREKLSIVVAMLLATFVLVSATLLAQDQKPQSADEAAKKRRCRIRRSNGA